MVIKTKPYDHAKILATYAVAELVEEAAVCMDYCSGGGNSQGPGTGGNSKGGGH